MILFQKPLSAHIQSRNPGLMVRFVLNSYPIRASAFNSGNPDAYKAAVYDLWKSIRNAKRDYRNKVEFNWNHTASESTSTPPIGISMWKKSPDMSSHGQGGSYADRRNG